MVSNYFSLAEILYAQRSKPRGDEAKGHISDIWNCDRATWMRRNGIEPEPSTPEDQAKFAVGLGYEMHVVKTLRDAGFEVRADFEVELYGLTGHPDGVVNNEWVLETKTTDARKPKDEVQPHHAIQAAAYALAVGVDHAVVYVKQAGSHIEVEYHIEPEGYRVLIARRAQEVLERTHPGAPMPPAEPSDIPTYSLCQYCKFRTCDRNPKYQPAEDIAW